MAKSNVELVVENSGESKLLKFTGNSFGYKTMSSLRYESITCQNTEWKSGFKVLIDDLEFTMCVVAAKHPRHCNGQTQLFDYVVLHIRKDSQYKMRFVDEVQFKGIFDTIIERKLIPVLNPESETCLDEVEGQMVNMQPVHIRHNAMAPQIVDGVDKDTELPSRLADVRKRTASLTTMIESDESDSNSDFADSENHQDKKVRSCQTPMNSHSEAKNKKKQTAIIQQTKVVVKTSQKMKVVKLQADSRQYNDYRNTSGRIQTRSSRRYEEINNNSMEDMPTNFYEDHDQTHEDALVVFPAGGASCMSTKKKEIVTETVQAGGNGDDEFLLRLAGVICQQRNSLIEVRHKLK